MKKKTKIAIFSILILAIAGISFLFINNPELITGEQEPLSPEEQAQADQNLSRKIEMRDHYSNIYAQTREIILNGNLADCADSSYFEDESDQRKCKSLYLRNKLFKEVIKNNNLENKEKYLTEIHENKMAQPDATDETTLRSIMNEYLESDKNATSFCEKNSQNEDEYYNCVALLSYDESLCDNRERSKDVLECKIILDADISPETFERLVSFAVLNEE